MSETTGHGEPKATYEVSEEELMLLLEGLNQAVASGDATKTAELQTNLMAQMEAQLKADPFMGFYSKAQAFEWEGRWAEAEQQYREALELARLTEDEARLVRAYSKLGEFLELLDRDEEAAEAIRLAEQAAPKDRLFVRATTIPAAITWAIKRGELERAKELLDESATYIESEQETRYAFYVLQLAEWRLATGEISGVEVALDKVRANLEPSSKLPGLAGAYAGMGHYWELRSRIFKIEGDLRNAGAAMWENVQLRRSVSRMPQITGPQKFHRLALALRDFSRLCVEAGYLDEARKTKADSDEIRRLIHLPPLED